MKRVTQTVLLLLLVNLAYSQNYYFTKTAKLKFKSDTPLELIEGVNNSGSSVVDPSKGTIEFGILLKSFIFDRALLQEHFHENYLESEKFPKASFKGNIINYKKYNLNNTTPIKVKVEGNLTMHGITKAIVTEVEYTANKSGAVATSTVLKIVPEDYGIKIPSVVRDKISKVVEIAINAEYKKLEKKVN